MSDKTEYTGKKSPLAEQAKTVIVKSKKRGLGNIFSFVAGGTTVFACLFLTGKRPALETSASEAPSVPDEPVQAQSVTENMSFAEAFATARNEVGATGYFVWHGKVFGTLYEDEMSLMSEEERQRLYSNTMASYENSQNGSSDVYEPVVVIHDQAPVADNVTDDMSFRDAFAVARAEVGPGGCFTWHGQTYNTYTNEEMRIMDPQERQEFIASVGHPNVQDAGISSEDVNIVQIDQLENTWDDVSLNNDSSTLNESLISEEYIDNGQGGQTRLAVYDVNGKLVARADIDNDGVFDLEMTPDENGNLQVQSNEGESITLTPQDLEQLERQPNDIIDSAEPDNSNWITPDDFDPDANMNEWQTNP